MFEVVDIFVDSIIFYYASCEFRISTLPRTHLFHNGICLIPKAQIFGLNFTITFIIRMIDEAKNAILRYFRL
jgi:hypothetical protein